MHKLLTNDPLCALSNWSMKSTDNIILSGARVFDPQTKLDKVADILIKDGIIAEIKHSVGNVDFGFRRNDGGDVVPKRRDDGEASGATVVDMRGCWILPGFCDMHVHLREPGYEHKETILTGSLAAMAGGFTTIACMPNTNPPIDNPSVFHFIKKQAAGLPVTVHPIAAITKNREGKSLSEFAELCSVGATAFSDDGFPVSNAGVMRVAMEYCSMLDALIIEHCEEPQLSMNGVMDEGRVSTALGLPGIPFISEVIALERNIRLAQYTGAKLHIAHLSSAASLNAIRDAKQMRVPVTAEVTPQHLSLTSDLLRTYDTVYKVNPPLRTQKDVDALIEGIADGTIDVIASDHAPHSIDDKNVEFIEASFGMVGLETTVGLVMTKLYHSGKISLERMVELCSLNPRRILGLESATIEKGKVCNLTIINPDEEWKYDASSSLSKGFNSPFHNWEFRGRPKGIVNNNLICLRQT